MTEAKAKELLSGDRDSVQDVAEMVGYSDLKYFSRLFKKRYEVSPSVYCRQKLQEQSGNEDSDSQKISLTD